jgi:hypothetical protein
MTLYSDRSPPGKRHLMGTRHDGPEWTDAVRNLRRAVLKAVNLASWRNDTTPDSVGMPILDHLDDYHPGSLHVLALVDAILVKASSR